jgi:hypothetical protein
MSRVNRDDSSQPLESTLRDGGAPADEQLERASLLAQHIKKLTSTIKE